MLLSDRCLTVNGVGLCLGGSACVDVADEAFDPEPILHATIAHTVAPDVCFHGMTTSVFVVDPSGPRCSMAQLTEMRDYVCSTSPEVCSFLDNTLDNPPDEFGLVLEHATIQCHPYTTPTGDSAWCADVVDRYASGATLDNDAGDATKNYFIAYADDVHEPLMSPEVGYWDAALKPKRRLWEPPVELSVAGYYTNKEELVVPWMGPPPPQERAERLFKFDPRTCGGCGPYNGPNRNKLTSLGLMQITIDFGGRTYWWPGFSGWPTCVFETQYDPVKTIVLDAESCRWE